MTVVALTGGVAAGKSTVADVLRSLGSIVIDADVLARQALATGSSGLALVAARFGPDVLLPGGDLNREALGAVVFADPGARSELNAIVHPEVRRLYQEEVTRSEKGYPGRVLVYDVPLLAEARDPGEFDLVVVVDASADIRRERLQTFRGLSQAQAQGRLDAQASDGQRLALADVVIESSGSVEETRSAARELFHALALAWPDRLATVPKHFPSRAP
jgi:dephospho-CoA kinase